MSKIAHATALSVLNKGIDSGNKGKSNDGTLRGVTSEVIHSTETINKTEPVDLTISE